ncbi:MAG: hypothetical protein ACT4P3_06400 [Betaproteobacteria bacterium]
MDHTWTSDPHPEPNGEHPIVAVIAVVAILVAILLIAWARVEVHGTEDVEAALTEPGHTPPTAPAKSQEEQAVDDAVTASRFATGFSP